MSVIALQLEVETTVDAPLIDKLHERAFGPGRFARTAFRIREQADHDPRLSFVARVGSYMVGSVRQTAVWVGAEAVLVLGPLTVEPAFEGRGIGRALLERAAIAAQEAGFRLIMLVGDAAYYKRFGYHPIPPGQILMPGPVDPARFLALELEAGALKLVRGMVSGSALAR